MRTIFRLPLLLAVVLSEARGQPDEPPPAGFVRFVNAVSAGGGNTRLRIDGEEVYPTGYRLGQRSGGIGLKPGTREIEVRKEGVAVGRTRIEVKPGATCTLVAFAEKTEDGEGPTEWRARILRLRQSDPERGYRLTVVSVCGRPEVSFRIATAARRALEVGVVRRFDTTSIDLGHVRGDVEIRLEDGNESLCGMSLDEPGNYVAVFYEDAGGKVRALTFYDPKFVVAG